MEKTSTNHGLSHNIHLTDKKRLVIDRVINVEGFDEEYLSLSTHCGTISVEGHELKIESLTKEDEKIMITGEINGIFYVEGKNKKGIGKFFK